MKYSQCVKSILLVVFSGLFASSSLADISSKPINIVLQNQTEYLATCTMYAVNGQSQTCQIPTLLPHSQDSYNIQRKLVTSGILFRYYFYNRKYQQVGLCIFGVTVNQQNALTISISPHNCAATSNAPFINTFNAFVNGSNIGFTFPASSTRQNG